MLTQFEGILARPRLLALLTDGGFSPVYVLSSPPGYGKTILARQFVDSLTHPVIWHAVQQDEQDVTNLYHAALRHIPPGRANMANDLPSAFERSPVELARDITARLRDVFSESAFTYVLDDWHRAESLDGNAWLWALVEGFPANGQILILSRTRPHLDYVHLLAHSAIVRINQTELRFSAQEVSQLAALYSANPEALSASLAPLEGWPAGVVIALQRGEHSLPAAISDHAVDPARLFDRLADDMFRRLDSPLQNFLLASSTLEAMTPVACRQALGFSDAAIVLDQLRHRQMFVVETPAGLVYHALFRQFLQGLARQQNESQFLEWHRQAASWFEVQGQMPQAFAHYLAGEAFDRAAALADELAPLYFSQGKFETLLSWERALVDHGVPAPHLTYECTIIHYNRFDYDQALAGLEMAEMVFLSRHDETGLALIEIQRAWIACQSGTPQGALDRVMSLLSFADPAVRGHALRVAGFACQRLMRYEESIDHFRKAETLFRQLDLKSSLSHLLQDLGMAYTSLGQLDETGVCLQQVVALRRQLGSRGALALALNNLGYHYYQHNDFERARATFREALSLAAQVDDQRAQIYLHWSLGDLERDLENWAKAEAHFQQGLNLSGQRSEPGIVANLYISLSTLYRRQGFLDRAQEAARLAMAQPLDTGMETLRARAALHIAQADRGSLASVLEHLQSIIETLEARGEAFERSGLLTVCAGLAAQAGDSAAAAYYQRLALQAVEICRTAQAVVAELGVFPDLRPIWDSLHAPSLVDEAWQAREAGMAAFKSSTKSPSTASTYSLDVQTFGALRIERNGALVLPRAWQSRMALELFLYLIVTGPQTKEEIGLTFWADRSKNQLHTQFHTELNRARQAVGKETILFDQGRYHLNPALTLNLDFVEFEEAVRQARLMPDSKARAEHLWETALHYYRGPFLSSLEFSWVLPLRERFEMQALEAHHHLARLALARQAPEQALAYWQAALLIDPYREEFHREIMQVYAARGESALIARQYQILVRTLRQVLDVEPSHETQRLYQQLLKS